MKNNKDSFLGTKWDARNWTYEQKTKWQEAMFALGITWFQGKNTILHLNGEFFYVSDGGKITFSFSYDLASFGSHKYKQMYFEDVFPEKIPTKASIEVGNPIETPNEAPIPANTKDTPLNHVSYYGGDGPYEVLKIIEALELGFHTGNVFKYIARAGKKDPSTEIEDLKKAEVYLRRYIEFKERENVSKD
jgi:hypothetical protein